MVVGVNVRGNLPTAPITILLDLLPSFRRKPRRVHRGFLALNYRSNLERGRSYHFVTSRLASGLRLLSFNTT